jgi:hypothetical protein
MKRLVILAVAVAIFGAATAAAADNGSWGNWEPTEQGAISVSAGAVCPFPVTAEPVRQDLRLRYHYDQAGNADGYEVIGPLVARVTNTSTGKSVIRNLSGQGTVIFGPDGSWEGVVNGGFLIFFRAADDPARALLFFEGHTVLHGSPTGEKTLVSQTGQSENLCTTLA